MAYDVLEPETKSAGYDVIEPEQGRGYDVIEPDLSQVGQSPYDKFKLQEFRAPNLPSYSEAVPKSLNPDYDFTRATRGQTILAPPIAAAAKLLGSKNPEQAPFEPLLKLPHFNDQELSVLPPLGEKAARVSNEVLGTVQGLSSPIALAQLPVNEAMAIPFATEMAADAPGDIQDILNAPDSNERTSALAKFGTKVAMGALMAKGLSKEAPKATTEPGVSGRMIAPLQPKGATPPPLDELSDVSTVPSAGPTFSGIKETDIPKIPKAEVPETAPEAERGINVSEEIRSHGARTIADIQRLFPQAQLTRESARALRNAAWGEPDANGNLPEQLNKEAGQGETAQLPPRNPEAPTAVSNEVKPQEPPRQPTLPQTNVTPPVTQVGELPIDEPQSQPVPEKNPAGDGTAQETTPVQAVSRPSKILDISKAENAIVDKIISNKEVGVGGFTWEGIRKVLGLPMLDSVSVKPFSDAGLIKRDADGNWEFSDNIQNKWASKFHQKTSIDIGSSSPFPESAPEVKPESSDSGYGIAERVREERAQSGTGPENEPGKVPNAEESVENGRKMIQQGVDPESALKNFEETGQSKATDIALVRAQGEKLAKAASYAADENGIGSPEYEAAKKASFDWEKRTKKLQTDWAERGQAQQGHTDLDTGNFHELARAHYEATGKEFTPGQAKTADILSKKVRAATTAEEAARKRVLDAIKEPESTPAEKGLADKISSALEKAANDAYARIRARAREGKVFAGLDPLDLADHALFGAAKIAKGAVDFGKWSAEMAKDLGDYVKPHLKQIWDAAHEEYNKRSAVYSPSTKREMSTQQKVWQRAKALLNEGENDFDDIRHKIATEMGLPVKDVTRLLSENQSVKRMSDEMYRSMAESRRLKQQAKSWLKNQQTPGWVKFTKAVPRAFFAAKVFGHGTVGMITHAGLNVFNPLAWKTYFPEFLRQFPMAVKTPFHDAKAFHERMMQDLMRDPNYITARRAGLANDPFKFTDDYQNPGLKNFIEKLDKANPISGSRGFDALKTFRQARFNQIWNAIPDASKTPNMAKVVADAVNHSSGVVKTTLPEWMRNVANVSLFAPKLEMSRWAWLVQDPAKAAITFTNWKNATPEARVQAIMQVKEKATIAAVYYSLLAANQGLLKASGSNQSVNMTDPTKSDFLSFKVDGHKVGVIGPMIGMVKLFAELVHDATGKRTPAEKRDSRFSEATGDIGKYVRGKASPFAKVAIDFAAQSDFRGQPLPFSKDKVPAFLRREGLQRYTWPKYAMDTLAPIPFEEAIREVWSDMGLGIPEQETYLHALLAGLVAGGTGVRYSKDFQKPSTGAR